MKGFKVKPIPVGIKKLDKEITLVVSVKETREFKVRMWLAKRLWVWGVRIAGCGIRFDEE